MRVLGLIAGLTWASPAWATIQDSGIVVVENLLPPAGTAYHGAGLHTFLDGRATLVCSSHGGFTNSVEPPKTTGATVVSDYFATFTGELTLVPPLVGHSVTYPIVERAHMVERITFARRRGGSQVLETEMQTFDLRGAGMPEGVLVREAPSRRSPGSTTITALSGGRYRIDGFFDVWLEISLDGGRSWHSAQAPVRMSIAAARDRPRRLSAGS